MINKRLYSFRHFFKKGELFQWIIGGAVALNLFMVFGMIILIMYKGLGFFWPSELLKVELKDGTVLLGEKWGEEVIPFKKERRIRLKIGNRDIYGRSFRWFNKRDVKNITNPKETITIQRQQWGNFYGYLKKLNNMGNITSGDRAGEVFLSLLPKEIELHDKMEEIKKREIEDI
ncbi:MAG: hypothetical protein D6828_05045, partial [Nitrospirae bacterium]